VYGINNPTSQPADTITVSGTGQVALPPDIANITFSVMQTAATAAAAQTAVTKQANAAISYVEGQGIADSDIATQSYDISPQYTNNPCGGGVFCPATNSNTVTGYQVSETVQVTIHDLTKVSAVLEGLGQENVQDVSGPDFGLSDPNEGTDAARAKAIENAKQEAQTLAAQLGVSLGRIVSFNENGGGIIPEPMFAANTAGGGAAAAPNIPTGQNQYSSTVSITYVIH
jgi:uncharacterized protein YggE